MRISNHDIKVLIHRLAMAALPMVGLSACTQGDAGSATDSAGVRIVASAAPAWVGGTGWVVDSVPLTRVGGTTGAGAGDLAVVVGAMRQSDGTIVVADQGASQLKYFTRDGALRAAVGRKGEGPGEFRYLASLWACGGDSAFVEDIGARRVHVYDPAGTLARTFALLGPERNTAFSTSCSRRGQILTTGWGDLRQRKAGAYRPMVKVAFSSPHGEPSTALGSFPGTEMFGREQDGFPRRAGKWLRIAMAEGMAWLATNEDRDVRGYGTRGKLQLIIRRPGDEPAFSAADRDFIKKLALDSALNESQRQYVEKELQAVELPDRPPAVSELIADATGHVWLRPHPRADRPNPPWQVFGPDGAYLGEVTLPAGVQVLEIGGDYVLGLRNDAGVGHTVLVLRLNKGA
jgi:hypothetical protein